MSINIDLPVSGEDPWGAKLNAAIEAVRDGTVEALADSQEALSQAESAVGTATAAHDLAVEANEAIAAAEQSASDASAAALSAEESASTAADVAQGALSAAQEAIDAVDDKADDDAVVHLTGNETIAGTKTFEDAPTVPDASFTIAKVDGLQAALDDKADTADLTIAGVLDEGDPFPSTGIWLIRPAG